MTWGRRGGELHPVFGNSHLEEGAQAVGHAEEKGMDTIHFARILPGTHALEFLSQSDQKTIFIDLTFFDS